MKINSMQKFTLILSIFFSLTITAQVGGWNPELKKDADAALTTMVQETPKLRSFLEGAYAYVIFPKVTKAGIGIGGAAGNGVVYMHNKVIGTSKLKQASIGFQLGGQQYSEVIFFENQAAFERFTNGNLKFDGQASAVAIKKGVSLDIAYADGVAVFTQTIGGLMYEASIGGQHFTFKKQ